MQKIEGIQSKKLEHTPQEPALQTVYTLEIHTHVVEMQSRGHNLLSF